MTELKPCFCGTHPAMVSERPHQYYVVCFSCRLRTLTESDEESAAQIWNARAEPQPKQPEPCPWCDNSVNLEYDGGDRWHIECQQSYCRARGPSEDSRISAIAAWNSVARKVRAEPEKDAECSDDAAEQEPWG